MLLIKAFLCRPLLFLNLGQLAHDDAASTAFDRWFLYTDSRVGLNSDKVHRLIRRACPLRRRDRLCGLKLGGHIGERFALLLAFQREKVCFRH